MKKNMMIPTAAIGVALSGNAMADIMWKNYKAAVASRHTEKGVNDLLDVYIAGAVSAYGLANSQLQIANRPPLYCQPEKLALNPSNVRAMLDDDKSPLVAKFQDDFTLGMAVFYVLHDAFPCKRGRS